LEFDNYNYLFRKSQAKIEIFFKYRFKGLEKTKNLSIFAALF